MPQRPSDNGLFDKSPPHDLDAERGVLASILLQNAAHGEVTGILKASYFYLDAHQKIYTVMEEMLGEGTGVDAITLSDELRKRGLLEDVGNNRYLGQMMDSVPHHMHAKYWAGIVRSKWQKRSLIYSCTTMLRKAYEDTEDDADVLLSEHMGEMDKLQSIANANTPRSMHTLWMDYCDSLSEGTHDFIPTGFCDLDAIIGGMLPTEVYCLAARPGMGKTALSIRIAMNVAKTKHVYYQSLEMSSLELFHRIVAQDIGYSVNEMRDLEKQDSGLEILYTGSQKAAQLKITVDQSPDVTVSQLASKIRMVDRKSPVDLVIIDYLQLLTPEDKRLSREQQVSSISAALKRLAKTANVPIIALSQLNRRIESRSDRRPMLSDLREGGGIENDCDIVMFIDRPSVYDDEANETEAKLYIEKVRRGPTGVVSLHWDGRVMKFSNAAKSFQELESRDYFN